MGERLLYSVGDVEGMPRVGGVIGENMLHVRVGLSGYEGLSGGSV